MTDITAALSSADDALNPGYAAAFDDVHRQLATALLALHSRCEAMAKVVEAAEKLRDHESTWCLVQPSCGKCDACSFNEAVIALRAQRGGA